jgi:uridine phosphorylase
MDAHITAKGLLMAFGADFERAYPAKALFVGQKERLDVLFERLSEVRPIVSFLGVELYEAKAPAGDWIVGLSGLFAPQAALALEMAFALGVRRVVRVGSCGALDEHVSIGDVILATGAISKEGTSEAYLSKEVPYVACPQLLADRESALGQKGLGLHAGLVCSIDAFLKETPEFVAQMQAWNVIGVDMVTSVFFALSHAFHAHSAAALVVSDNLATHEIGFFSEPFQKAEAKCLEAVLESL